MACGRGKCDVFCDHSNIIFVDNYLQTCVTWLFLDGVVEQTTWWRRDALRCFFAGGPSEACSFFFLVLHCNSFPVPLRCILDAGICKGSFRRHELRRRHMCIRQKSDQWVFLRTRRCLQRRSSSMRAPSMSGHVFMFTAKILSWSAMVYV